MLNNLPGVLEIAEIYCTTGYINITLFFRLSFL